MTKPPPAPIDVDELRRLAEKATPGPWCALHNDGVAGVTRLIYPTTQHDIANLEWEDANDNASFIAAFNPTVALALLSEIERLRSEVDKENRLRRNAGGAVLLLEGMIQEAVRKREWGVLEGYVGATEREALAAHPTLGGRTE